MTGRLSSRAALALVLSVSAAACGTETGLLIEVTRDDTVPAEIGRLEFHVGTDLSADYPSHFVDLEPEEAASVAGRDLAEDPFLLMLRPGEDRETGVMVAVLAFRGEEVVGFGALSEPVRFVDGAVARWPVVLSSTLPDGLGVTDTGCLTYVDQHGRLISIGAGDDRDCDGWADGDCDDLDPAISPGANESCGNAVDDDCDGAADENVDEDGDQVTTCGGDCDDSDSLVRPGAAELCDGIDNDCSGACDDGLDADGDLYTPCGSKLLQDGSCVIAEEKADCNDEDDQSYPGAAELCDGADNDCDQECDEDPLLDRDGDRYTACGSVIGVCGRSDRYIDCAEEDPAIHPGAREACNGVDDDCDGSFLQVEPCFGQDGEGSCYLGTRVCIEDSGSGDYLGACEVPSAEGSRLPGSACDTYADCEAGNAADPYACAVEGTQDPIVECKVGIEAATGAQCDRREVVLPSIAGECAWTVIGGQVQGDYEVGLRPLSDPNADPQPALNTCPAVLRVTVTSDHTPRGWYVPLRRSSAQGDAWYFLELAAVLSATCEPPDGLSCTGLSAPP